MTDSDSSPASAAKARNLAYRTTALATAFTIPGRLRDVCAVQFSTGRRWVQTPPDDYSDGFLPLLPLNLVVGAFAVGFHNVLELYTDFCEHSLAADLFNLLQSISGDLMSCLKNQCNQLHIETISIANPISGVLAREPILSTQIKCNDQLNGRTIGDYLMSILLADLGSPSSPDDYNLFPISPGTRLKTITSAIITADHSSSYWQASLVSVASVILAAYHLNEQDPNSNPHLIESLLLVVLLKLLCGFDTVRALY